MFNFSPKDDDDSFFIKYKINSKNLFSCSSYNIGVYTDFWGIQQ